MKKKSRFYTVLALAAAMVLAAAGTSAAEPAPAAQAGAETKTPAEAEPETSAGAEPESQVQKEETEPAGAETEAPAGAETEAPAGAEPETSAGAEAELQEQKEETAPAEAESKAPTGAESKEPAADESRAPAGAEPRAQTEETAASGRLGIVYDSHGFEGSRSTDTTVFTFSTSHRSALLDDETAGKYPELKRVLDENAKELDKIENEEKERLISSVQAFAEGGSGIPYDLFSDITEETVRADEDILSILRRRVSYYGGVHGDGHDEGLNYDPLTGEKLGLADVIADQAAFKAAVYEKLSQNYPGGNYDEVYINEILDYEFGTGDAPRSYVDGDMTWVMDDSGITVCFNTYVIGPYADGEIMVRIKADDYKGVISPDYTFTKKKAAASGSVEARSGETPAEGLSDGTGTAEAGNAPELNGAGKENVTSGGTGAVDDAKETAAAAVESGPAADAPDLTEVQADTSEDPADPLAADKSSINGQVYVPGKLSGAQVINIRITVGADGTLEGISISRESADDAAAVSGSGDLTAEEPAATEPAEEPAVTRPAEEPAAAESAEEPAVTEPAADSSSPEAPAPEPAPKKPAPKGPAAKKPAPAAEPETKTPEAAGEAGASEPDTEKKPAGAQMESSAPPAPAGISPFMKSFKKTPIRV